jgi:hypothetical protein
MNILKNNVLMIHFFRIHGRVLRMDYVKDTEFTVMNESGLYELEDLVKENKASNRKLQTIHFVIINSKYL